MKVFICTGIIAKVRVGGYKGKNQEYAYVGIQSRHAAANPDQADIDPDDPRTRRRKYKSHMKPSKRTPFDPELDSLARYFTRCFMVVDSPIKEVTNVEFLRGYRNYCKRRSFASASVGKVVNFLKDAGLHISISLKKKENQLKYIEGLKKRWLPPKNVKKQRKSSQSSPSRSSQQSPTRSPKPIPSRSDENTPSRSDQQSPSKPSPSTLTTTPKPTPASSQPTLTSFSQPTPSSS